MDAATASITAAYGITDFGLSQAVVQPSIGGGASYASTDWRNLGGQSGPTGFVVHSDDNNGPLAYQAAAGVAVPLTWLGVTGLSLTAQYRFFGALQPKMFLAQRSPVANTAFRAGTVDVDNDNHSVMPVFATRCSSRRRLPLRPRPCRPLRHARLQPAPVAAPRRCGGTAGRA